MAGYALMKRAQMGVKRMTSLIEYTHAYCADNDIRLTEKRWGNL